jgi:hypothetical protein
VPFLELKECHCRWPLGDPREPGFACCGLDRVTLAGTAEPDPRTRYCAFHLNLSADRGVSHGA